jgi:hypothetical protein
MDIRDRQNYINPLDKTILFVLGLQDGNFRSLESLYNEVIQYEPYVEIQNFFCVVGYLAKRKYVNICYSKVGWAAQITDDGQSYYDFIHAEPELNRSRR